ncbi:MAG: amidohydrolase family protein [Nitrospirae bacterium]|nr:amidohydrolase family protein [Nitrospirota bacterium]
MRWALFLLAMVVAGIGCLRGPSGPERLVLRPGLLIDGTGAAPRVDTCVVVEGERLAYVGPSDRCPAPEGTPVLDLPHKVVMPGLINAHVHLLFNSVCSADAPVSLAQFILNVKVTLAEGVTTVADLAAPWQAISGLRAWVDRRPDSGPRILAAGPFLTAPGSYPFDWMPKEYADLEGAIGLTTADQARRTVQDLAAKGANFIKVGIVSKSYNGRSLPSLSDELVRVIADAAHARGLRVLAHVLYADDWARAVRLPIDAIVHNALEPISDDTLRAVVARGLPVAPTVLVWSAPLERALEPGFLDQPWVRERLDPALLPGLFEFKRKVEASPEELPWLVPGVTRALVEQQGRDSIENLRRLHRAGALIGVGTDAAVCFNQHGSLYWEMERMMRAGMNESDVLRSATFGSARVLGIDGDVGTLEAGKRADLLVLDGNPAEDLANLRRVSAVVKSGEWYVPPRLDAGFGEKVALAWAMKATLGKVLF